MLERVRRPANGRQGDMARGLGDRARGLGDRARGLGDRARGLEEDTYNKKRIQKCHNKPCFFACQLIN